MPTLREQRKERHTCTKCGRNKMREEFFTFTDGERVPECKDCFLENIDNNDPDTIKPLLKQFDIPYYHRIWVREANLAYKKNPGKFGPKSVFGRYIRTMRMSQYKSYHYCDTDALNGDDPAGEGEELDPALLERYESGQITKSQLATLVGVKPTVETETPVYDMKDKLNKRAKSMIDAEDRMYLMGKWGTAYTEDDWLRMETLYNKYANEYDLDTDREESVKKICKATLKMDEAMDSNNFLDAKNLQQMLDSLRKSASLTAAQNKADKGQFLDSIGQLVQLCEREGGIIEQFPDPMDYPQDKIDLTLNDMKSYTSNLIKREPNMAGIIEGYIQKLDQSSVKADTLLNSQSDVAVDAMYMDEEDAAPSITQEEREAFAEMFGEVV